MNTSLGADQTPTLAHRWREMLHHHGAELDRVASMLTDDVEWATRLVVRAVVESTEAVPGLRSLSADVVTGWLGGAAADGTSGLPGARSRGSLLDDVHALPDDQRALLALCAFGEHTYREAAAALSVPPADAAQLLGTALRALRASDPTPDLPPVMA